MAITIRKKRRLSFFEMSLWIAACVSLSRIALTMVTDKSGFALTPIENALWAFLFLTSCFFFIATNYLRYGGFYTDIIAMPFFYILFVVVCFGLGLGIANGGQNLYIISTTVYWINWGFAIYLFSSEAKAIEFLDLKRWAFTVAIFSIFMAFLSSGSHFYLDIFLVSVAVVFIVYCGGLFGYFLLAVIFIDLSSVNRATILSFLAAIFIASVMARKIVAISACTFLILFSLYFIAYVDLSLISDEGSNLNRRLTEIKMLMFHGASFDDFIPLQQRFYEVDLVNESVRQDLASLLLGRGFGATISMSDSADTSIHGATLLGAEYVHNIHFLTHSLLLRSGYIGLLFLVIIVFFLIYTVYLSFMMRSKDLISITAIVYCTVSILYAATAANFFFVNFSIGGMLVVALIRLRAEKRERTMAMLRGFDSVTAPRRHRCAMVGSS